MEQPPATNPGEINEQWWNINGLRIHGYVAGSGGPPVVLLHGGGIDSAWLSWRCLIGPLSLAHRVYAFDWPGYGESEAGDSVSHTLGSSISLVGELMDGWGLEKATLAGISMGGAVALGFALQNGSRVDRLVLVDPYGIQQKVAFHFLSYLVVRLPWMTDLTYAYLRRSRWAVRETLKFILSNPGMPDEGIVEEVWQAIQKPGAGKAFSDVQKDEISPGGLKTVFLQRIPELQMPVLLVHGEKDALVPLACARQAQTLNPAIRLEILPNCGHWPQRDWPDRFNTTVLEFLA